MDPGFAFLFAPSYHPAMKNVAPVRRDLGFRTVFNLLGPICNPAGVRRQLIGIYAREWLEPVAHVLADLGTEKAWIVHGADGLDEMSTTGTTHVAMLENGRVTVEDIVPEDAGLERSTLAALKGGTAEENARAIRELFAGAKNAFRDIVLLNAAAALIVADEAANLSDGRRARGGRDRQGSRRVRARAGGPPPKRAMTTILDKIAAYKREEVKSAKAERPLRGLLTEAREAPAPRGFRAALECRAEAEEARTDRRDQEGEPEPGRHPRRFRTGEARARL